MALTRFSTLVAVLVLTAIAVGAPARVAAGDSPPGRILFIRNGNVWEWSHGKADRLVRDGALSDPVWSLDGRSIAYVRSGNSYSDVVVRDLTTNVETPVTNNRPSFEEGTEAYAAASAWASDPSWAGPAKLAYLTDSGRVDGSIGVALVDLAQKTDGTVETPGPGDESLIQSLSISADGARAVYIARTTVDGAIGVVVRSRDLSSGRSTDLLKGRDAMDPSYSPDGSQIALAIRDEVGMTDVWLLSVASGDLVRITQGAQATSPAWSPDGGWLAYYRVVDFGFQIWATSLQTPATTPVELVDARGLDPTSGLSWGPAGG